MGSWEQETTWGTVNSLSQSESLSNWHSYLLAMHKKAFHCSLF